MSRVIKSCEASPFKINKYLCLLTAAPTPTWTDDWINPGGVEQWLAVPRQAAAAKCQTQICSLPPHLLDCCDYPRGLNVLCSEA